MADNVDGLGIGFEAQDDGASKVVDRLNDSVNDLWGNLKKVGDTVPRIGKGIGSGLRKFGASGSKSIGMVGAAIGGLVDKAMDPQLDTAYASMYAGFNKSFSAMTAGMKDTEGRLEKARKKIGGIAQGMGEDMEGLAESYVSFEKHSVDLEKVLGTRGLTQTVRRLAKTTSVYGVEGKQLAMIAGSLKHGFGLTEQQIGSLADKMVYFGREFNMGREAMQAWPAIMESLNKDLADFGKDITPEDVDKYTMSVVKLGAGFKTALGLESTQAMELARESMGTLMKERDNIRKMTMGMGSEFGPMTKALLEAGDDTNKIFKQIVEGDPVKFLDLMHEISKGAREMQGETGVRFQRLSASMNEALGADTTFAMKGNWGEVSKQIDEVTKGLGKSAGTFGKIAEQHWKSSITSGEAWDMMVNNMKAKVFKLSNKEVGRWKKNMQAGFKETFGIIEAAAKDKGPLGQLTTKLLAVQRVGLSALLPGLGSLGPLLSGIATDALPMLTALGSMGVDFRDLGKLVGAGGAGYLFFQVMTKGPDKVIESFEKMGDSVLGIMETKVFGGKGHKAARDWIHGLRGDIKDIGLFEALKKQFDEIDWAALWGTVSDAAADVFDFFSKVLDKIPWEDVGETVFKAIGTVLRSFGNAILGVFGVGQDGKVAEKDKSKLEKALTGAITSVLKGLKGALKGAAKGLWESIFDPTSITKTMKNVGKLAMGALAAGMVLSKGIRGSVLGLTKNLAMGAMGRMGRGARGMMGGAMQRMRGGAGMPGGYDVYGSGLAGLVPGLFGGPMMPGMMPDTAGVVPAAPGTVKPPPVPSRRRQAAIVKQAQRNRRAAMLAQKRMDIQRGYGGGGLTGGQFMGGYDVPMMDMVGLGQGQVGAVPRGGLEAGMRKKPGLFRRMGRGAKGGIGRLLGGAASLFSAGGMKKLFGSLFKLIRGGGRGALSIFKGLGKAVGGLLKGFSRLIGPIGAVFAVIEGFQQLSERNAKVAEISNSKILTSFQKTALESETNFMAVANTVDSLFLGLPSMIGGALDISSDDVKRFYHHAVASAEWGIGATVDIFKFLGRTAVKIWDYIGAKIEGVFNDISLGITKVKVGVLDTLFSLAQKTSNMFHGLANAIMYPFDWLSFKMKGWMADFLEMVFGKPGEDSIIQKILSYIPGFDEDSARKMVEGARNVAKGARMAQEEYLEGEKTFDAAREKKVKREDDARNAVFDAMRKGLADEEAAAIKEHRAVKKSLDEIEKKSNAGAIAKDFTDTKNAIMSNLDMLGDEAERKFEAGRTGESNLEAEKRRKGMHVVKEEPAAEPEKKKRRRKKGGRAPKAGELAEMEGSLYRTEQASRDAAVSKAVTKALKESPLDAYFTVPVQLNVDGKKMAETVIKHERKVARTR